MILCRCVRDLISIVFLSLVLSALTTHQRRKKGGSRTEVGTERGGCTGTQYRYPTIVLSPRVRRP